METSLVDHHIQWKNCCVLNHTSTNWGDLFSHRIMSNLKSSTRLCRWTILCLLNTKTLLAESNQQSWIRFARKVYWFMKHLMYIDTCVVEQICKCLDLLNQWERRCTPAFWMGKESFLWTLHKTIRINHSMLNKICLSHGLAYHLSSNQNLVVIAHTRPMGSLSYATYDMTLIG